MPAFAKLVPRSITKFAPPKPALGEGRRPGDTPPVSTDKDNELRPIRAAGGRGRGRRCPSASTPRSISSAASARPGPGARTARRTAGRAEAVCTIELDSRWAQGLRGLETSSHVVVLYWMDRARRDLVLQAPRHYGEQRGTFALRSPVRPNPIAMSVVRLMGIEGTTLSVVGLDCLDGTPLIDIKPYFASTDAVPDAVGGLARQPQGLIAAARARLP